MLRGLRTGPSGRWPNPPQPGALRLHIGHQQASNASITQQADAVRAAVRNLGWPDPAVCTDSPASDTD